MTSRVMIRCVYEFAVGWMDGGCKEGGEWEEAKINEDKEAQAEAEKGEEKGRKQSLFQDTL
jgi:hypothetical protein